MIDTDRAIELLDIIDGIVDDTHPEGDGCPLCVALDDLRAALAAQPTPTLDAARLAEAMSRFYGKRDHTMNSAADGIATWYARLSNVTALEPTPEEEPR